MPWTETDIRQAAQPPEIKPRKPRKKRIVQKVDCPNLTRLCAEIGPMRLARIIGYTSATAAQWAKDGRARPLAEEKCKRVLAAMTEEMESIPVALAKEPSPTPLSQASLDVLLPPDYDERGAVFVFYADRDQAPWFEEYFTEEGMEHWRLSVPPRR